MTPTIIFDADWLSSFLKIGRLDLVRQFYQVEQALVPSAVYREIAQTDLLPLLIENAWIKVEAVHLPEHLSADEDLTNLGPGEQECIALALDKTDAVLLISDNKARQVAHSLGVVVVNIPAFLLACKMVGLVDRDGMIQIIRELKEKDYYEFRQDVQEKLLQ